MVDYKEQEGTCHRVIIEPHLVRSVPGDWFWCVVDESSRALCMVESVDFDGIHLVVFAPPELQDLDPVFIGADPVEVADYLSTNLVFDNAVGSELESYQEEMFN